MYGKIKEMAEEALKLQNKNFMDETFKRIIAACESALAMEAIDASEAELRCRLADSEFEIIPGTTQPKSFYVGDAVEAGSPAVDEAALGVQDAIPWSKVVGEFSTGIGALIQPETDRKNAEILANMDAMLGEIPPGPQVALNPAEVAYSVDASGKPELPPVLPDSKKKAKTGGAK